MRQIRHLRTRSPPAGLCQGQPGHQVLQPIDGTGTSVFKQKSMVPVKFLSAMRTAGRSALRNTKSLNANMTYVYRVTLADNSIIQFQFGLK